MAFWEGGAYLGQGLSRYCLQQAVRARAREAARALEPEANKEFVDNGYQGDTYVGPRQRLPRPRRPTRVASPPLVDRTLHGGRFRGWAQLAGTDSARRQPQAEPGQPLPPGSAAAPYCQH